MKPSLLLSVLTVFMIVSGCAVSPRVTYIKDPQSDLDGLIKFNLSRSILLVDYSDPKTKDKIAITAVPIEATDRHFAIRPDDFAGVTTHLKVTKRPNTNLIETLGTDLEDKRIAAIEQVGSALVGVVGVLADVPQNIQNDGPDLPLSIDLSDLYLTPANRHEFFIKDGELAKGWLYDLSVTAVPADAVSIDDFEKARLKSPTGIFFYSACRTVTLTFTTGNVAGKTFSLTISDPNFVQTIRLPEKGSIEMHSSCGSNVKSEKADVATTSKLINTLIAQAKSLKAAKDKAGANNAKQ